jgi:hypothetical protein
MVTMMSARRSRSGESANLSRNSVIAWSRAAAQEEAGEDVGEAAGDEVREAEAGDAAGEETGEPAGEEAGGAAGDEVR